MAAPLAPGYRQTVLWQEQAPVAEAEGSGPAGASRLPSQVDLLVVGAGYAGLSVAREVASAGRSVLAVDAWPVGWGASTRNGGMVIPELKAGPAALERSLGPLGRRLYRDVNDAFDHVESLVAGPAPTIPCDYERSGQLYLAHAARLVPGLRAMAREHAEDLGEPVRFVPREELAEEVGTSAYHAGVVFERTGGLHPARFHAGLLSLARAAGAVVAGSTRATGLEARPGGFRVTTTRGTVAAGDVAICTNAYADGLVPSLARRVLPVGSFIIATEVLEPDLAKAVSPRGRMLVDSKNFLYYWRLSPDGRLLFGGRRSLAPSTIAQARDFLYDSMVAVHPQLAEAGARVDRAWGGNVAITLDRLPHAGRVAGGAWYVTGCNGSGVALNTWMGAQLGRHLVGEAPPPSFTELPHRPIPLQRLRRLYLPLLGLWFHHQDRGFHP
jgi:glycine/D-amino acid oxidase-like deaminating enzyme